MQLSTQIPEATALQWGLGAESVVRDVYYQRYPWQGGTANAPLIMIGGPTGGGGRWYNTAHIINDGTKDAAGFRYLKVDHSGDTTQQPSLRFYMLNPEHAQNGADHAQMEFNTVKNINVYGLKGETESTDNNCNDGIDAKTINTPLLSIVDSSNIRVFGQGGIAHFGKNCASDDRKDSALVKVLGSGSYNLLFANFGHQNQECVSPSSECLWSVVKDGTTTFAPARDEWFTLYKRGTPTGPPGP